MIIVGISGNVVKDPVLHHDDKNDRDYTYVRVATRPFGGYATRYFDVEVVRESAKACVQYLKTGKAVNVAAYDIDHKEYMYTKKDENGKQTTQVIVSLVLRRVQVEFGASPKASDAPVIPEADIVGAVEIPAEQAESEQAAAANPLEDDALPF